MTLREWIQHVHARFPEIVRVSGDDDEIVNERGRCNQASFIGRTDTRSAGRASVGWCNTQILPKAALLNELRTQQQ
jgi:hypothetical protein